MVDNKEIDLTICMATCGRPKAIKRCLRSIDKNVTYPHKIAVLDNTPYYTDEPIMEWAKTDKRIDIYLPRKDLVFVGQSNQILADACDTKYIMHIDDDIYFDKPGIIEAEMDYIKKHPDIGIVSCAWLDKLYGGFREIVMKWQVGYDKNGTKCFRKYPIPYEQTKQLGLDVMESDECLHSMIINRELVYDKGIKWDETFEAKGDRASFFLQCRQKNVSIRVLTNHYIVHDPMGLTYGSVNYTYAQPPNIKERFYKKYGYWPLTNWDGPQWRLDKDNKLRGITNE